METGKLTIVGRMFSADFGEKAFTLCYEDKDTLVLTAKNGPDKGGIQKLHVSITKLRPNLFMVNWQETNKLTVTDIENYEKSVLYANMTTPNDSSLIAKGILKEVTKN